MAQNLRDYDVTFRVHVRAFDEEDATTMAARRIVDWDEPICVEVEED